MRIPLISLFHLLQRDIGEVHARFGAVELYHLGDYLDNGDNLSRLDHLPRFFLQLGDDTGYLRLDLHLETRLYVSGSDRLGFHIPFFRGYDLINGDDRLRFLP